MGLREAKSIEEILNDGLELFGLGRIEAAIEKWRQVLSISPGEPRALDYLSAAGVDPAIPDSVEEFTRTELTAPIEILDVGFYRRTVAGLVSAKKYEEALGVLTEARRLDPGDQSLSRSMSLLKQHLGAQYRASLGRLEQVVSRKHSTCPQACDPRVWRLFDGITTIDDVIHLSPIGEFRTLKTVCSMLDAAAIEIGEKGRVSAAPESSASPSSDSPLVPDGTPEVSEYDALFREASTAYLRRDHTQAIELFERCKKLRPEDGRVTHNLAALRKRVSE